MKVTFRTDATCQIGTGHFMRCVTLADGFKKHDAQICFVSRNLPDHLRDMLAVKDIEHVSLENNASASQIDDLAHSAWLETSQAQDAQDTIQILSGKAWDWLVVDHYALDARWESAMRGTVKQSWSLMTLPTVNMIVMCCWIRIFTKTCKHVIPAKSLRIASYC